MNCHHCRVEARMLHPHCHAPSCWNINQLPVRQSNYPFIAQDRSGVATWLTTGSPMCNSCWQGSLLHFSHQPPGGGKSSLSRITATTTKICTELDSAPCLHEMLQCQDLIPLLVRVPARAVGPTATTSGCTIRHKAAQTIHGQLSIHITATSDGCV